MRPLYRDKAEMHRGPDGNAGLWFDKFCDRWHIDRSAWTLKSHNRGNPKLNWIESVANKKVGIPEQITDCVLRLARLSVCRGGKVAVYVTDSRFVTGLGRSHPVENGFAWHPTLGTPYLPGSSIKGLVRSWARTEVSPSPDQETLSRLLGRRDQTGCVCFLDAVPVAPVMLEADVMTPHYAGWTETDPPGDWRSPNPIPFLTTSSGTPFLFGLVPCCTVADEDLNAVWKWLGDALQWAGAGAKAAVGYGRFCLDGKKTDQWMQRLDDEDREPHPTPQTPEGRWSLKFRDLSEEQILDWVRIHLQKKRLEDRVERKGFAEAVKSTGLVPSWRRGKRTSAKTRVGKKKLKQRAHLIDRELEPD